MLKSIVALLLVCSAVIVKANDKVHVPTSVTTSLDQAGKELNDAVEQYNLSKSTTSLQAVVHASDKYIFLLKVAKSEVTKTNEEIYKMWRDSNEEEYRKYGRFYKIKKM